MRKYAVLVNTCDKFEDCWAPFFKLFLFFWPDCKGRVYLNTELKDYNQNGLDIVSLKVGDGHKGTHLNWSQCLLKALDKIEEEVVLYLQEDYFLKGKVQNDLVERFVDLIENDKKIDCIQLTDQAVLQGEISSSYDKLYSVLKSKKYRMLSCQAALWRKDALKYYIREYETAWQFEEFGSKRAYLYDSNFYVVDNEWIQLNKFEIIPYVFTGIIQGRWKEEVVALFDKHSIDIDFTLRGFVNDAPKKSFKRKLDHKLKKIPVSLRFMIERLQFIK